MYVEAIIAAMRAMPWIAPTLKTLSFSYLNILNQTIGVSGYKPFVLFKCTNNIQDTSHLPFQSSSHVHGFILFT
jgi:hypothetical protein